MPGRKWRSGWWKAWRRWLLLPVFLLLVALGAAVLPPLPITDAPPGVRPLFDREPEIRALLIRLDPGESFRAGGPCRLRNQRRSAVLEDGGDLTWDGRSVLSGDARFEPPVELTPPRGGAVKVGPHRYSGRVRLVADGDDLLVINHVGLEEYLAGVIAVEMGLHFPDEALEAQTVACRSYAVHRLLSRRHRPFDVGATQATQVYRGVPRGADRARRVVEATRGEVLTTDGEVLDAVYSSTCGGATRSAEEAFGNPGPSCLGGDRCGHCDDAPLFRWNADLSTDRVRDALHLSSPPTSVERLASHPSGRLIKLVLATDDGPRNLRTSLLRKLVGRRARSDWITGARIEDGRLLISGRGFGHGVGLCQYGARGLALERKDRQEILRWYYPGAGRARAW